MADGAPLNVPQDLRLVGDDELASLATQVDAEFDRLRDGDVTPESLALMQQMADDHDRIAAEIDGRAARRTAEAANAQRAMEQQRDRLATRVHGDGDGTPGGGGDPVADVEAIAAAAARGTVAALMTVMGGSDRAGGPVDLTALTERATASLTSAQRHAPPANVPRGKLAITAGVDIPGVAQGGDLDTLDAAVQAVQRRAKSAPVTAIGPAVTMGGSPALTIRNQFEHLVDDRTSTAQVGELIDFLTRDEAKNALVAGGGWCAPSEIRYDFFNIACEDGIVDLPTVGISRGGIKWPTSPSLADANFAPFGVALSNTSNPWLWTETDDQLTVTGSTNKPCVRVPCPSFNEARLECYGVCLTAGNLTDDAYPEATANTLRLLLAAHSHAVNSRILATMASLSSAAITGGEFNTPANPVFQQVVGGIELGAVDYRARYGMCMDDVLEVVVPYWLLAAIRADLRWRAADQPISATRAQIEGYFRDINVRVQFVGDWQVRGTGQFGNATAMTAWPITADVMIYAAGTFVLGNGMTLDLGVVRDSVLNAENDFTAAWSEECHLLARVGHESRRYTIGFNVNGATSALATLGPNL